MRKTEYKSKYKELVRAGKIKEAKSMLQVYRETGEWGKTTKTKPTKRK